MSAVARACWPQQQWVMNGEGRCHLAAANAGDDAEVQRLDLCALARHAVERLRATGQPEGAAVQLELPDEPVFARVSGRRLEQVMLHLIAEAMEARRGEEASARAVRLKVEPQDDFGDYGPTFHVRYAARDAAEQEPRATPEEALQGCLATARRLVEALGGLFSVKSRGRTGTTITVELPDQGTASW